MIEQEVGQRARELEKLKHGSVAAYICAEHDA